MASDPGLWRTPALDRFAARVEIPLLVLSVLLIPVLIIPEVSSPGRGEDHSSTGWTTASGPCSSSST